MLGVLAVTAAACGGSGTKTSSSLSPPTQGASVTPTSAPSPAGTSVTAKLTEYRITLSQQAFSPGSYTFVADNAGATLHALKITGPGLNAASQGLQPGQSAKMTVTLQAGAYDVSCPVDGHKSLGMDTLITVAGAPGTSAPGPAPTTSGGGNGY
jgi:plastocyanin